MKKNVMCIVLAITLLVMAIPAFAAGKEYSTSYTAGKVKHYFTTSRTLTKSSSEAWLKIEDQVTYSKYCNNDSGDVVNELGSHTTYLTNSSGTVKSGPKTGQGCCTITFNSSDIGSAKTLNEIKFRICNPEDGTNKYLKTAGTMWGEVKTGIEVDTIIPDLNED